MKCLNISVHSISSEKGDWVILLSARLMASMVAFWLSSFSLFSDNESLSLDSLYLSLNDYFLSPGHETISKESSFKAFVGPLTLTL